MIVIRRTIESDIPGLARIVCENYTKETAEHFVPEVELSFAPVAYRPWFYTAVEEGERIVGCGGYVTSWICYGAFTLCWVNVDVARRDLGIGRAVVNKCLDDLRCRANLVILATSVPEFYSKGWGFETLLNFQGDQMTDTLMTLKL